MKEIEFVSINKILIIIKVTKLVILFVHKQADGTLSIERLYTLINRTQQYTNI